MEMKTLSEAFQHGEQDIPSRSANERFSEVTGTLFSFRDSFRNNPAIIAVFSGEQDLKLQYPTLLAAIERQETVLRELSPPAVTGRPSDALVGLAKEYVALDEIPFGEGNGYADISRIRHVEIRKAEIRRDFDRTPNATEQLDAYNDLIRKLHEKPGYQHLKQARLDMAKESQLAAEYLYLRYADDHSANANPTIGQILTPSDRAIAEANFGYVISPDLSKAIDRKGEPPLVVKEDSPFQPISFKPDDPSSLGEINSPPSILPGNQVPRRR